jgi:flavin-dependent dehydrogenase
MTRISKSFDVIIIGGGPAGSAAAVTLIRGGFRVAIIERTDYLRSRIGETLPSEIRILLTSLGVWQHFIIDSHIESFTIRSSWGTAEPYDTDSIYNPYGSGWHVDRARFDRMLAIEAKNAGAILFTDARVRCISKNETSDWKLAIIQHNRLHNLHAPLVIDATGQTAAIPIGLPRSFHVIDHLIGIVLLFAGDAEPYILVEAAAHGWWYSAPLPHSHLVVVYMTDADLFAAAGHNSYQFWHHRLAETKLTSKRVGTLPAITEIKIVSAASLIRRPVCGTDWLAAGDASMTFDPLSGCGVYNALKGGILAGEAVIGCFHGNSKSLVEYSDWINSQFSNYLQMRNSFYNKERRWSDYPFWRRRHLPTNQWTKAWTSKVDV